MGKLPVSVYVILIALLMCAGTCSSTTPPPLEAPKNSPEKRHFVVCSLDETLCKPIREKSQLHHHVRYAPPGMEPIMHGTCNFDMSPLLQI